MKAFKVTTKDQSEFCSGEVVTVVAPDITKAIAKAVKTRRERGASTGVVRAIAAEELPTLIQ